MSCHTQLGSFLSPDTIVPGYANPQDLNRMSYANNNSLRYTDPSGHRACDDVDAYGNCITAPGGGGMGFGGVAAPVKPRTGGAGAGGTLRPTVMPVATVAQSSTMTSISTSTDTPAATPMATSTGTAPYSFAQNNQPAIPILGRVSTLILMIPVILAVDESLEVVTLANTAALATDPEPVTKAIFLTSEIMVSVADIGIVYFEVGYLHWVATGEFINRENMFDWAIRP
jgi:hypothetical protein